MTPEEVQRQAFEAINALYPAWCIGEAGSRTSGGELYVVFRNGVYHEEAQWERLPHLSADEAIQATCAAVKAHWPTGKALNWRNHPEWEYGYNTVDGRDLIKLVDGKWVIEDPEPEERLWILRVRLAVE